MIECYILCWKENDDGDDDDDDDIILDTDRERFVLFVKFTQPWLYTRVRTETERKKEADSSTKHKYSTYVFFNDLYSCICSINEIIINNLLAVIISIFWKQIHKIHVHTRNT